MFISPKFTGILLSTNYSSSILNTLCYNYNKYFFKVSPNEILLFPFVVASFFSTVAYSSESVQISLLNDSIKSKDATVVIDNGDLKIKIPRLDSVGKIQQSYETTGTKEERHYQQPYEIMGTKEELSYLEKKIFETAEEFCKLSLKPKSATISVFFTSATWEVDELCELLKNNNKSNPE